MLWVVNRPPGVSAAADRPLLVVVAATSASKSSMPDQVHASSHYKGVPLLFYGGGAVLTALVRGPGHAVRLVWVTFGALLGIIYGGVTPVHCADASRAAHAAAPRARARRRAAATPA
eukprot:COSAG01_NODE_5243_length_4389_cov_13.417016_4_plen_117_part_00